MIKTLRITIIVTAIVAVVFFVLSAVFGLRHDKDKEAFLANPSATAVFKKGMGNKSNVEADAPLVTQAQALALRLNPPKPKEPVSTGPIVPVVETPKFRLLGTSFYPEDASRSMALIDEPGKGMHWVVAGDKVGYLTITQIADGKITYTDGKKSTEMMEEKPQAASQINVISVNGKAVSAPAVKLPLEAAVPVSALPQVPEVQNPQLSAPQPTAEQVKENVEFVKKLINDPNSVGVNTAEANDLKGLGELLQQLEKEQAQTQAEANQPQAEPNSAKVEPNDRGKVDAPQKR